MAASSNSEIPWHLVKDATKEEFYEDYKYLEPGTKPPLREYLDYRARMLFGMPIPESQKDWYKLPVRKYASDVPRPINGSLVAEKVQVQPVYDSEAEPWHKRKGPRNPRGEVTELYLNKKKYRYVSSTGRYEEMFKKYLSTMFHPWNIEPNSGATLCEEEQEEDRYQKAERLFNKYADEEERRRRS